MEHRDLATGLAELARARSADEMIWSSSGGSSRFRRERNDAVRSAHGAGVPLEQIADELGVVIADVESMISEAERPDDLA